MLYLALGKKEASLLAMLKDFIQGETDSDFFLTYVRAKGDDTLSGLMTQASGFTSELSKRLFSLIRETKETKAQMKVNKAFDRFSDQLLDSSKSDSQALVTKLLSKLQDQALLSLAKHPSMDQTPQEESLRKPIQS